MKCKRCEADFDPLQVKDALRLFNIDYDGLLCYECAVEKVYQGEKMISEHDMSQEDLGLMYKEAIEKEMVMVELLLEQCDPNSDRIQELSDELLTLWELRSVPPEELPNDLWVRKNINIDMNTE